MSTPREADQGENKQRSEDLFAVPFYRRPGMVLSLLAFVVLLLGSTWFLSPSYRVLILGSFYRVGNPELKTWSLTKLCAEPDAACEVLIPINMAHVTSKAHKEQIEDALDRTSKSRLKLALSDYVIQGHPVLYDELYFGKSHLPTFENILPIIESGSEKSSIEAMTLFFTNFPLDLIFMQQYQNENEERLIDKKSTELFNKLKILVLEQLKLGNSNSQPKLNFLCAAQLQREFVRNTKTRKDNAILPITLLIEALEPQLIQDKLDSSLSAFLFLRRPEYNDTYPLQYEELIPKATLAKLTKFPTFGFREEDGEWLLRLCPDLVISQAPTDFLATNSFQRGISIKKLQELPHKKSRERLNYLVKNCKPAAKDLEPISAALRFSQLIKQDKPVQLVQKLVEYAKEHPINGPKNMTFIGQISIDSVSHEFLKRFAAELNTQLPKLEKPEVERLSSLLTAYAQAVRSHNSAELRPLTLKLVQIALEFELDPLYTFYPILDDTTFIEGIQSNSELSQKLNAFGIRYRHQFRLKASLNWDHARRIYARKTYRGRIRRHFSDPLIKCQHARTLAETIPKSEIANYAKYLKDSPLLIAGIPYLPISLPEKIKLFKATPSSKDGSVLSYAVATQLGLKWSFNPGSSKKPILNFYQHGKLLSTTLPTTKENYKLRKAFFEDALTRAKSDKWEAALLAEMPLIVYRNSKPARLQLYRALTDSNYWFKDIFPALLKLNPDYAHEFMTYLDTLPESQQVAGLYQLGHYGKSAQKVIPILKQRALKSIGADDYNHFGLLLLALTKIDRSGETAIPVLVTVAENQKLSYLCRAFAICCLKRFHNSAKARNALQNLKAKLTGDLKLLADIALKFLVSETKQQS